MTAAQPGRQRDTRTLTFAAYVVLAVLAIVALFPTVWVILSSFSTKDQIYAGSIVPTPPNLDGYRVLLANANVVPSFVNTVIYATVGTIGSVVVGFLAAYATVRARFPGRGLVTLIFSASLAIPVIALLVPEYKVLSYLRLYDTKLGMSLFYAGLFFPLSFVILRAYLSRLSAEIEESARVEGAGYFTIVWRIVVPLMRPAIATVVIIDFISIWNEFLFALVLAPSPGNSNLQIMLSTFRGQFTYEITAQLAGTVLVMAVPIVTFLLLQRQVLAGLAAGSGK